jgi:KaiC/GvpD/RAD55 family RecA-like ATPase
MGIPIDVPGLDTLLPEIPERRLVVVESGPDPAKSYFVRRLAVTAAKSGRPLTFITTRDRAELIDQLTLEGADPPNSMDGNKYVARDSLISLDQYGTEGGLLAIDSFSFLTLDLPAVKLSEMLRELRAACREKEMVAVLATDRGMFDVRAEAVINHLADGIVEFHSKEGPEGVFRFMRIPKWMDGRFTDRNIHYDFDGRRMAIDLRRRVL